MKIGFIGLPKSGKTTLFNALTGSSAQVSAFSTGRVGPNLASVRVYDERVENWPPFIHQNVSFIRRLISLIWPG